MTSSIRPVAALLAGVAVLVLGNGLVGVLIPIRASIERFSAWDIGLLGAGYYVGFTLGCFLVPLAIKRSGHIRAFAALAAIASATVLLHSLFPTPLVWISLRIVMGFCLAGLYMVIESWLNASVSSENRGRVFSIYVVINHSALVFGQLLINLADPAAFPLFAVVAILLSLGLVPVTLSSQTGPAPITKVRLRPMYLIRISPVGVAGAFASGLVNGAFWSLAPLFAQRGGHDVAMTAFFMSAVVLGGALCQWPLGRASDKVDRRRIILLTLACGAVASVLLTFFGRQGEWQLLLFGATYGAFAFSLNGLSVAHTNDHAAPEDFVEVSSGLLMTFGIGAVLGPLLASLITGFVGFRYLFLFAAGVYVATAAFVWYRMTRRDPVAPADKDAYKADAPTATPEKFNFDPRSDVAAGNTVETTPTVETAPTADK